MPVAVGRVFMDSTLEPNWIPAKVQFHADRVGRFVARSCCSRWTATAGEPLRAQLETALREAIRAGRLGERRAAAVVAGARPPARRLPRSGAGVLRPAPGRGLPHQPRRLGHPGGRARRRQPRLGARSHRGTGRVPRTPSRPTSATGVPDLASFPRADWAWALRGRSAATRPTAAFDYGDPAGAARRCARCWPATCAGSGAPSPARADVVVCAGFAQGLTLVLRALARGRRAPGGVRGPGLRRHRARSPPPRRASRRSRCRSTRTASTSTALAASGARAVVLTPAHQWPTGVVLAPERRHALVGLGRADATPRIIEDDYDAEFRYDREPVGALQGLAPDRVVAARHREQVARAGRPARLDRLPTNGWSSRSTEEKQRDDRGSPGPRPARPRPADRVGPLRPAPAPDADASTPAAGRPWSRRSPRTRRGCG